MSTKHNKIKQVNVRFSDRDYEELKERAEELGVKLPEAVRRLMLIASAKSDIDE